MNFKNVVKFGLKWNEVYGVFSEIYILNDRIWKYFFFFFMLYVYDQLCRINCLKIVLLSQVLYLLVLQVVIVSIFYCFVVLYFLMKICIIYYCSFSEQMCKKLKI